ncbi:MAG: hypothetical protein M0Z43_09970 [Acidithiobacillus sp.]|nr:hypothetical protein [Acidithiobacillus sp.]
MELVVARHLLDELTAALFLEDDEDFDEQVQACDVSSQSMLCCSVRLPPE